MAKFHFVLFCVLLSAWRAASEINNCLSNPCLNNSTCVDGDNYYTCICTHEFTGVNCNETCPARWTPFEGRCYIYNARPSYWWDARTSCRSDGGNLVDITSATENAFLVDLKDSVSGTNAWIGLYHHEEEYRFVWSSSGNVPNFTNWRNGEPSLYNSINQCIIMLKDGEWDSLYCDDWRSYFCERPTNEFRYCSQKPCQNGGTCFEVENNYNCSCRPEYFGMNCEEFNNCFQNPCLNGATCVDGDNEYTCICTPEFQGYNCTKTCQAGWTTFDGSCYRVNTSPVNWASAQSSCRKDGGDLVDITNVAQHAFLTKLINTAHVEGAWIGLNNHGNGSLIWVSSGDIATLTTLYGASFVKGCVEMCTSLSTWKDLDCESKRSYVCKLPLVEPCPVRLALSQRSCYSISTSLTDWFSAQTSCRDGGGRLVEINSLAENAYMIDLMDVSLSVPDAWIGLKVRGYEDTNSWASSGNVVNFTNWAGSVTSSSYISEDCVVTMANSGEWKKLFCGSFKYYICEYSNKSSHCSPDPCLNGGKCIGVKNNYTCSCRPGFLGRNCEEFNSCYSNPCANGGTCVDGGNYYVCNCIEGFMGGNCMETCPAGWTFFKKRCYSFSTDILNWISAQTSCRNSGGNLVQINNAEENAFLVDLRAKAVGTNTIDAWIGLRKTNRNTPTYTWISSGKVAKFTNWESDKPNGKGCVEIWRNGKWDGFGCEATLSYFCERSVIVANNNIVKEIWTETDKELK